MKAPAGYQRGRLVGSALGDVAVLQRTVRAEPDDEGSGWFGLWPDGTVLWFADRGALRRKVRYEDEAVAGGRSGLAVATRIEWAER